MQCRTCGAQLPTMATNCPSCGAATAYNSQTGTGPYAPTYQGSSDPTQMASAPVPPTAYGSPPPPPGSSTGYDNSNPYGGGTGSPYDSSGAGYGSGYGSQQAPPSSPGGYQQPGGYYAGGAAPQVPATPGGYSQFPQMHQQPPNKSNTTVIVSAISVVVVVAIVIAIVVFMNQQPTTPPVTSGTPTATSTNDNPTPTPTTQPAQPGQAADIVFNPALSKSIDSDYFPVDETTSFSTGDDVYITFELDPSKFGPDVDGDGIYGYVYIMFYDGSNIEVEGELEIEDGYDHGYASIDYPNPTTEGKVELYWAKEADFSDKQLAQTLTFTVS